MKYVVLALAIASATGAQAQSFPSRPITLVVPLPAGGTADLLARLAAEKMRDNLGQQVIVENRAGGVGGLVGTEYVYRAAPDGYTLLCAPQLTFSVNYLLSLLQKGVKQDGRVAQFGPAEGACGNSATVFQLAARVL